MKRKTIVLALACVIEAGCAGGTPDAPSATWTVSGAVVNASTALPLAGATVSVLDGPNSGRAVSTGADGTYALAGLTAGTSMRLVASFECASDQATVSLAKDTQLDFRVRPVGTPFAPFSQTDLRIGSGVQAGAGNTAVVAYTGWLYDPTRVDGKGAQFDSGAAFTFIIGAGAVIKGWDQGVPGMRVGGQRRLTIPPNLAYGCSGSGGGVIGPNATLVFDITLNTVR